MDLVSSDFDVPLHISFNLVTMLIQSQTMRRFPFKKYVFYSQCLMLLHGCVRACILPGVCHHRGCGNHHLLRDIISCSLLFDERDRAATVASVALSAVCLVTETLLI